MKRRTVVLILSATLAVLALFIAWVLWFEPSLQASPANSDVVPPPETEFSEAGETSFLSDATGPPPSSESVAALWEAFAEPLPEGWEPWAVVADAKTGEVIFESGLDTPHTPASTTKLLTGFLALTYLDPSDTLKTGVSLEGSTLYLWGEGDVTLAYGEGERTAAYGRAGVADLAAKVADELSDTPGPFTLVYQADFAPERRAQAWYEQEVTDFAGDVAAFAIDTGRTYPGAWDFVPDSAEATAQALERALEARGVTLSAVAPGGKPPAGAEVIAQVESAPLIDQIRFMLETSDNTMAEQLCHLADAASGQEAPTFASSTARLVETLQAAGVDTTGMVIGDCSGLDENNRIPPRVLLETMQASFDQPGTAVLTRLLPVAAVSGTMTGRLEEGEGNANYTAKTGSLGRTSTIAGIGTTRSGAPLYVLVGVDNILDNSSWFAREPIDAFLEGLFAL